MFLVNSQKQQQTYTWKRVNERKITEKKTGLSLKKVNYRISKKKDSPKAHRISRTIYDSKFIFDKNYLNLRKLYQ